MAIGTTPLFSKISGSAGPVDFRTRRNGKIEIGKKRIPANPQSTEQQNTRNAYGRLHELWQNEAWIDKTQYENIAAAYDISPWNAFLMRHLPIMRLNPVAYWPFVEGTGSTLHDLTLNENHGTISGAVWQQSEKYNIPHLYFDGIDDFVNCGNNNTLDMAQKFTAAVIFKPYRKPQDFNQVPFGKGILGGGINYGLYLRGVNDTIRGYATALDYAVKNMPDNMENNFNKIAISYDTVSINLYLNNETVGSTPFAGPLTTNNLNFMMGSDSIFHFDFNGWISELFILPNSISSNTYTHLYNMSKKFYEVI